MKYYQAQARKKGDTEWQTVKYSGQEYFADKQGVGQLVQMTEMMASVFKQNEYKINEVEL